MYAQIDSVLQEIFPSFEMASYYRMHLTLDECSFLSDKTGKALRGYQSNY